MADFQKTELNEVRRVAKRGKYDRETIYNILDEGFVCHVGFVLDDQPFVIPTLYARMDDSVVIHGSSISRMLTSIEKGIKVCLTVTLIDGLVLARSAFHHSMNYRSAVVFGKGEIIESVEEKLSALKAIADNTLLARILHEGRWNFREIRQRSLGKSEMT